MAHLAQPQPTTVSGLRGTRMLVVAGLIAVGSIAIVLALVLTIGSGNGSPSGPSVQVGTTGFEGGPSLGTVSAVSRAFGAERVRPGGLSLTTNVPELPRFEAGPTTGTPSAVSAALSRPEGSTFRPPRSLTTNVQARHLPEAGPSAGTPAAVSRATSGR
jgi:hypothetical protein